MFYSSLWYLFQTIAHSSAGEHFFFISHEATRSLEIPVYIAMHWKEATPVTAYDA